jgi:tetratricopeptide (TPR) repeat protein
VPAGVISSAEATAWLQPIIVSDTRSTNNLRYELSSEAMTVLNELQLSGKYPSKTTDLLNVYSHLVTRRNSLFPLIDAGAKAQVTVRDDVEPEARGAGAQSPFIDRDKALDRIRGFMSQNYQCAFILSGMRGIGKSSLVEAAFRQVIAPSWRKIKLTLTEGVSSSRLLAQLGYACNLPLPEDLDLSSPEQQLAMEQRIVSYLSKSPAAVVVFEDFQYLLNGVEIQDRGVQHLLTTLLQASEKTKTKYFLISDVAPRLGPEFELLCAPYSLKGLERQDTSRLLSYWFQFQHEAPVGQPPSPSDRLLTVLGGHPLATRVAARLWAEHPSQDIARDMTLFKELRDTIVAFILGKLSLSVPETDLMLFASILRVPAPRDLFVRWNGERANNLLNSLTSQYLIESSEDGYQLHPLVREYYYQGLPVIRAMGFHKVAGKFYHEWFEKEKKTTRRLVPELLGEAVHHYLAAADRRKVQDLAFFRSELRPVAHSHYQKNDFETALKDYLILADFDDKDEDAHYHLARIYASQNHWDEAEMHFGKAIALRPNGCWILQGYAAAKRRAGRLEEAQQLLDESLKINPLHSPTLVELGRVCENYKDMDSAEDYYERAIQADSNNFWAYYRLARLLSSTGDSQGAFEMVKAAVATNPSNPQARQLLEELKKKLEQAEHDPA